MAKSAEMNDIVKVSKIGLPTFNSGYTGTSQPISKSYQVSVAQFTKELPSNDGSSDEHLSPVSRKLSSPKRVSGDKGIPIEMIVRSNAMSAMKRVKEIEDNWKFKDQFQRRFLPTNESCPKGGHSNIDLDRYCNFLEFPSTSTDRRLIGFLKPKRVEKIITTESYSTEKVNGEEEVKDETAPKDFPKKNKNFGKTKKLQSLQSLVRPSSEKLPKNKMKHRSIYNRDDISVDEDEGFEYMPYFVTILEKDGSIRYVEDEGISSDSEHSDSELNKCKSIKSTAKSKILPKQKVKNSTSTSTTESIKKPTACKNDSSKMKKKGSIVLVKQTKRKKGLQSKI